MFKNFLVLSLCLLCAAQQRPQLPESFRAEITTDFADPKDGITSTGKGDMERGVDEMSQKMEMEFDSKVAGQDYKGHIFQLQRYDLTPPKTYTIIEVDGTRQPCQIDTISGPFPKLWAFLSDAVYKGSETIDGHTVQVWNETLQGGSKAVAVMTDQEGHTVPYLYREYSNTGNATNVTFHSFHTEPPHDHHSFEIPEECRSPSLFNPRMFLPSFFKI